MEFMKYELAMARIAELKALKNPTRANWQTATLGETVSGWWQALTRKQTAPAVPANYRAELMRQEWMVADERESVNNTRC